MFSEHFPMENSVTFLLDPNGNLERKAPEERIRCLPEQFRQAVCAFLFFFSSDACHEAADFLRGFFSVFFNLSHTSESRHSSNTWYISLPLICSIKALLLAVKSYCSFV